MTSIKDTATHRNLEDGRNNVSWELTWTPWKRTHVGGCKNFREIYLGGRRELPLPDVCGSWCSNTAGCTGFSYQSRPNMFCGTRGGWNHGACVIFSGTCKKEHNACWDSYKMVTTTPTTTSTAPPPAVISTTETPRPFTTRPASPAFAPRAAKEAVPKTPQLEECSTDGPFGVGAGHQCVFPFTYRGIVRHSCQQELGDWFFWCATATDCKANMIEWGHCAHECVSDKTDVGPWMGIADVFRLVWSKFFSWGVWTSDESHQAVRVR